MRFHQRLLNRSLKFFFARLYNQWSWLYNPVAEIVSLGMWRHWVLAVLPYLTGPRLLELGHGPGWLQLALHQRGFAVCGLDASYSMNCRAVVLLRRFGFSPVVVNGYAQLSPFLPGSFDQVVSTFPSDYIFAEHTLREVWRILKPAGSFLVLPLAWITGNSLPQRLAAALFRLTNQAPDWDDRLLDPLRQAGFSPVSAERLAVFGAASQVLIIRATKPPADDNLL
jgi:SAM-dependent methyltransferase